MVAAEVREFIMKKVAIIAVIVAALTFGVLNYHFILMDSSIKLLKKTDLTFASTFVDGRGAKKYKLYLNPALAKAGIKDLFEDESITIGK
jgi:hypothetical protein